MTKTFVIGGARSGKSRIAQHLAETNDGPLLFIATAQPFDSEMSDRIARHQLDRGPRWKTIDAPVALPDILRLHNKTGTVVLVDCLTVWLGNLMHHGHDRDAAVLALTDSIAAIVAPLVLVSNEVGQGIVPDNPMARAFRDEAGRLNQKVAAQADRVLFVTAGLVQILKG